MPSPNCLLYVEDEFGPIVNGCGSNFDFTLLFEETILSILPLCVAGSLAIFRIPRLWTSRAAFKGGCLLPLKLLIWLLVIASHAGYLALISIRGGPQTRATIAAGVIGTVGSLLLACLSLLEHRHIARTSSVLVLYLLATIPMEAVRARTLWRMLDGRDPAIAVSILAGTKFCALALELLWKCSLAIENGVCDAPEESNGIIERAFMLRMLPIFWAGYRVPLQMNHLSRIHAKLQTGQLDLAGNEGTKKNVPMNLIKEIFLTYLPEFLQPILPRLCFLALTFTQPFLLRRAIDYISAPRDEYSSQRGNGLIAAYALVYFGIAVVASLYEQCAARATTIVRADLSLRIYQHSLRLYRKVESTDSSTTMMTADVERVQLGVRKLHDAWASLAAVGIGLWLIELELGLSSLVTLALIGGSIMIAGYWSGRASAFQKVWMGAIEKRLHKTVQVLKGIKSIKQLGASRGIHDLLHAERQAEIKLSKDFRLQLIALVTLSFTSLTMLPALGLSVHCATADGKSGQLLSAQMAFEAMALFNIVSSSIQDGTSHIMAIMVALGSMQRIESFLNQRTWTDPRKRLGDENTNTISSAAYLPVNSNEKNGDSGDKNPSEGDVVMKFQNVSARWGEEGDMIIANATFHVRSNGLTIIVGPTGSGKSTMMRLALGDLSPSSGRVTVVDSSIAFCDQSPWIANVSIRDNIVGASPFFEERYETALRACALHQDLQELADGDQHLCGLNGQSVSGGQRTRIALARAIYSKADLVLLDDCLVGLDMNTERHILGEIFGPHGIFNSAPVTTILATSSPRYIPFADHVILVNADGSIIQQGTYSEVAPRIEQIEHDMLQVPKHASIQQSPKLAGSEGLPSTTGADVIAFKHGSNGDFAAYKWYFRAIGWMDFAVFMILCMLFVLGVIIPQAWLSTFTEKDLGAQKRTLPIFYGIFFGVGSAAFVSFACACLYLFLRIAVRTASLFHEMLLTTMLNAKMEFFSVTDGGVTLNRFSQDLQITDMELPLAFIGTTMNLLMLAAQCVVVTIQSHYAGFAILAIAVTIGLFHELYLRTSRRLRLMDIAARAPVLSLLLEALEGLPTVRAFGWAEWYLQRGIKVLQQSQLPFHFLQSAQITLNLSVDLFVATLAVATISIAVGLRNSNGSSLGLALFSIVGLGQSVKGVVHFWTSLEITLGAVARIRDFTQETESEHDSDTTPAPQWPGDGSVRFQNTTVSHSSSLPPIISHLTLDIKPGSKIAICGRTGSGKSTLINSLLRLVDISAGKILIDEVDITTLSHEEIRTRLVVLPQESLILSVSIRDYARLFGITNDDDIVRGLGEAGLWQSIMLGGGLDMLLSEENLSHGERQLFAMTLASLRQGKIVLMDEPTSHLDNDIQAQLCRTVFDKFPDSTVLCITHQIATILDFDAVIVLDEGKIAEKGCPRKLLSQSTSRFAQLYSAGEL